MIFESLGGVEYREATIIMVMDQKNKLETLDLFKKR
jgi:hypothetical protein